MSQPVLNENTRRPRQLNFEECCPCLDSGSPNHDVFGGTMEKAAPETAENCPCWAAPDSESASSIFTPTLRAVEPLIRYNNNYYYPISLYIKMNGRNVTKYVRV